MHLVDGRPVYAATDLVGFLACEHLTQLERAALAGLVPRPHRDNDEIEVIAERGRQHEARFLAGLRADGRRVTEIVPDGSITDHGAQLRAAAAATVEAMARGDEVIYQATFFHDGWRGHADFLLRNDPPSDLGAWSYEVLDTKLARKTTAGAILQLCSYSEHVQRIQGTWPEQTCVALGGSAREIETFRLADALAYYRAVKERFQTALETGNVAYPPGATYPLPVDHCAVCRWVVDCIHRRRADDHLSLVAFMRADQTARLEDAGIGTVAVLAGTRLPMLMQPERMSASSLERLQGQAALQVRGRKANEVLYELLEPEGALAADRGLSVLPEPSPGDLFLDLEGDPYAEDDGLEFLIGLVEPALPGPDGGATYHSRWAHDRPEEKAAFEWLIDLIVERRSADPALHVYHYGAYEPTALKKLMGRHATRETELDQLLRGRVFVDLYRAVRQGVRVSTESYSIKKLEPLYGLTRSIPLKDAGSAVVKYERWIAARNGNAGDDGVLDEIALYNQDDCLSALRLRDWLEERRSELADRLGEVLPRPVVESSGAGEELRQRIADVEALAAALTDGLPPEEDRAVDQHARWLLAQLLSWHRREDKSDWWRWFELRGMTDEDLIAEHDAIGELEYVGEGEPIKKSRQFLYRFDPQQEYKFKLGDTPDDPATGQSAGEIRSLDPVAGRLSLKRGTTNEAAHPRSLIPQRPLDTRAQQTALMRLGTWVVRHGPDVAGQYRGGRDLLLRQPPRLVGGGVGAALAGEAEDQASAARRVVTLLDGGCLPVQGPPGSGKTYAGARMIVDLVLAGRRVGVAATSHKVISNLLREACLHARETGVSLRVVQRADADDDWCEDEMVSVTAKNAVVEEKLAGGEVDVVGGTAWLWAREEMAASVDTLFVDEAGQMSLANVLSVCGAARNLVLLGDPQQLAQPSKGVHPQGAERSALEHILQGADTIPRDRGLFLATTWRLHPDVCAFTSEVFYEGRLLPERHLVNQQILGVDQGLSGTGIWFVPVESAGDRNASRAEADEVVRLVRSLLETGRWRDADGAVRPLESGDILVVSPYNAQVALIRRLLAEAGLSGDRVGTVDKFQGQEAPVVLYSMATSSAELAPRGMEFLYSLNRLNVATSRARALAVIVANEQLLRVRCRTPHQIRLANALCRAVELARVSAAVAA